MNNWWMQLLGNFPKQHALPAPWCNQEVVFADVGARGGPPDNWLKLKGQIRYVCFEPDSEEAINIREHFQKTNDYQGIVLARALGAKVGAADLHLTRFRPSSSILEPNHQLLAKMKVGGLFEVEKKLPVQIVTLDGERDAFESGLDFLKVDVQGYEMEVLKGASKTLDQIIGCELEVSFIEIYKNQPLFAEIDQFMRSHGFFLADLERFWWRRRGSPLEIQERGTLSYGNAFYLKSRFLAPPDRSAALVASLICSAMGLEEIALEIVASAVKSGFFLATDMTAFESWVRARRSQTVFWFKMGDKLRCLPGRRTLARWFSLWARALEGNSNTSSDAQSWNRKTSW
jgi:FkbM family methyltransferase